MATILIVEDDHNLGLMIKDILEFKEYAVILSKKPLETINNILNNNVDLVLLDKLILGIDGTTVCTSIRSNQNTAGIPILMMSAMNGAQELCLKAGATDFIYKPFEMDKFLDRVDRILRKLV